MHDLRKISLAIQTFENALQDHGLADERTLRQAASVIDELQQSLEELKGHVVELTHMTTRQRRELH